MVLLTIVDDTSFQRQSRAKRLALIDPMIKELKLIPGIIELYTEEEAKEYGIRLPLASKKNSRPASWESAISMLDSGDIPAAAPRPFNRPRRVVFYSYKGGVGRTTALIHTAFQLTRAGQKVALVDMDVEAPGLHTFLPPPDGVLSAGLVDYLWEREVRPFQNSEADKAEITLNGMDREGKRTGIVYTLEDPVSHRNLFVAPAGKVSRKYVQRLSILTASRLSASPDDPWCLFERDLQKQFTPDIILIDARTGLSDWGGLSLLQLADEAFIVLYPSEQNVNGVRFIRELLRDIQGLAPWLVLSPVPEGEIGQALIKRIRPVLALKSETLSEIYYHPSIAGTKNYPLETAMAHYAPLANILLELSGEDKAFRKSGKV
ncbi:MAG: AAA family ATPase [Gammaproteobacteria bacterium]|nr:AAA family ATPase [Gammaproteobacteria bacterium]